jgi:hypothetical protein
MSMLILLWSAGAILFLILGSIVWYYNAPDEALVRARRWEFGFGIALSLFWPTMLVLVVAFFIYELCAKKPW